MDENLPVKLKYRFKEFGYEVYTVRDMKWFGKENGELLQLMLANDFTTLLTIDNNLSYQQNFLNYPLQVVIMVAQDNTYETIMSFIQLVKLSIEEDFIGSKAVIHPSYSSSH